jgi:hypothetical protein
MGDLVLFLAGYLGVGAVARVGVGDEDGVVTEAGGAAGFDGESAVDGAGEYLDAVGVGVAERGGDGGAAVAESCGRVQDARLSRFAGSSGGTGTSAEVVADLADGEV